MSPSGSWLGVVKSYKSYGVSVGTFDDVQHHLEARDV